MELKDWIELVGAGIGLGTFLYGVISMRGSVKDFKDTLQDLGSKLDHWIESFDNETDQLKERMTQQETRCAERSCKYPGRRDGDGRNAKKP
jgi:hypothetical protein